MEGLKSRSAKGVKTAKRLRHHMPGPSLHSGSTGNAKASFVLVNTLPESDLYTRPSPSSLFPVSVAVQKSSPPVDDAPGILELFLKKVIWSAPGVSVHFSFFQVRPNGPEDLLSPNVRVLDGFKSQSWKKGISATTDPVSPGWRNLLIPDLTECPVRGPRDVLKVIDLNRNKRLLSSTELNSDSTRAALIYRLVCHFLSCAEVMLNDGQKFSSISDGLEPRTWFAHFLGACEHHTALCICISESPFGLMHLADCPGTETGIGKKDSKGINTE